MAKLTINEALIWQKTLRDRQGELIRLRDSNAATEYRYRTGVENPTERKPTYNVKKLDILVSNIAKALRLVDVAIKKANSTATVDYEQDDSVLGSLEDA